MVKDLRHVCVAVKDLKKSLRFYRDILGLKVFRTYNIEGEYPERALGVKGIKLTYVKLRTRGQPKDKPAVFELHYYGKLKAGRRALGNHLSFSVDNIEREYKKLKKYGIRFICPPIKATHGKSKVCFGLDPDNNLIEFVQELKK